MAAQIENGTAEGLNEFCDWLIKRGLMTSSAVEPLRSATKQVVATVDSELTPSDVNLLDPSFDADKYMDRFQKLAGSNYAPNSLNAYRRRFKRAVNLYKEYIEKGAADFKPPAGRAPRQTSSERTRSNGNGSATKNTAPLAPPNTKSPAAGMIQYPFPLASGEVAQLTLPARLTKEDAERMMRFIQALVFEPQRQIGSGNAES